MGWPQQELDQTPGQVFFLLLRCCKSSSFFGLKRKSEKPLCNGVSALCAKGLGIVPSTLLFSSTKTICSSVMLTITNKSRQSLHIFVTVCVGKNTNAFPRKSRELSAPLQGVVVRTPDGKRCTVASAPASCGGRNTSPALTFRFHFRHRRKRAGQECIYGWAGLDAGARSAPPRVMWLILALWRHLCPLFP